MAARQRGIGLISDPRPRTLADVTLSPALVIAALLTLLPLLAAAFFARRFSAWSRSLTPATQVLLPVLLCTPYVLVASSADTLRWPWLCLYALLPIAVSALLLWSRQVDPQALGTWRDFVVLATLGLAVDLRWFEPAWPAHLGVFNKILLLDLGIWSFTAIRQFNHVGFDLRLRLADLRIGGREFLLYTPLALALGLLLGFLHVHLLWPRPLHLAGALFFTFFFIAVPEELFFRGWLQNLLERRLGRAPALLLTAALFGLSHFNKRAVHFNWRYVLLAAIAGIFYGRAWRQQRRVGASAITHACVDTVWSIWLR